MHGHQIPIGPFGKTGRSGPAWTVALAFLCMACWFVPSAAAQRVPSNDLDPTFGIEGVVLTDLPTHDEAVMDVALQADGRILAMGSAGGSFILVRYRSGGG